MKLPFRKRSSDVDYEKIAVDYVKDFKNNPSWHRKLAEASRGSSGVSIAASGYSTMSHVAKRSVALWDRTIITHHSGIFIPVDRQESFDGSQSSSLFVDSLHLRELGKWIYETRELSQNGSLIFAPRIRQSFSGTESDDYYVGEIGISGGTIEPAVDAVLDRRSVAQIKTQNVLKSKYLFPIVTVDLPGIDNADLRTFSKLVSEQSKSVTALRLLLRDNFLEITASEGSELYFTQLERIGIEIRRGVIALSSDLRSEAKRRAFQVSGSVLASVSATLLAVDVTAIEQIGKIAASGGGIYLFLDAVKNILISNDAKVSSPFYYLWLLEQEANPL